MTWTVKKKKISQDATALTLPVQEKVYAVNV